MMNLPEVTVQKDSQTLSYTLMAEEQFFLTGYKVLQTQAKNGFVRCNQVLHNGKIRLVYDIAKYRTLESLLESLSSSAFHTILMNIHNVIAEAESNGFMQSQNIDLSMDNLYVDSNNYKVYLIYLPVNGLGQDQDYALLEEKFQQAVQKVYEQHENLVAEEKVQNTQQMEATEENIEIPLQDEPEQEKKHIFGRLFHSERTAGRKVKHAEHGAESQNFVVESEGGATEVLDAIFVPELILAGVRTPVKIELKVDRERYVIGKKEQEVDGYIGFNSAISRKHCEIVFDNGKYVIKDLRSANGTYVNGKRLQPEEQRGIVVGDKIRLANSDFIIKAM